MAGIPVLVLMLMLMSLALQRAKPIKCRMASCDANFQFRSFEGRDAFSTRRLWPFCAVDMTSRLAIGLWFSPWPAGARDRL